MPESKATYFAELTEPQSLSLPPREHAYKPFNATTLAFKAVAVGADSRHVMSRLGSLSMNRREREELQ
ncbi:hypothetical protein [Arthrobacter terricola]|uniref:hypothetical protein n=1 Tax=Arthrobacter terricola TaxID=2547396 RepID=UPI00197AC211|nr:hypothetical protein [Arthrobacter terricola]